MKTHRYTLRFYAANLQCKIVPLPLTNNNPSRLIDTTDNYMHGYDAVVRRVKKLIKFPDEDAAGNTVVDGDVRARLTLQPDEGEHTEKIYILMVTDEHLRNPDFFLNLSNGPLRCTTGLNSKNKKVPVSGDPDFYRPVITIGPTDVIRLYEETTGMDFETEEQIQYWRECRIREQDSYMYDFDHRAKFLDSSIWHRYVSTRNDFDNKLTKILTSVIEYADRWLYESLAALSTLEFQCRMLQNSYIANFGERGHDEAVTPFKFHSETIMAEKAERIIKDFYEVDRSGTQLSSVKWNVLMIDDYADQELSLVNEAKKTAEKNGIKIPTKKSIVEYWLSGSSTENAQPRLNIRITQSTRDDENIISEGVKYLFQQQGCSKKVYDIILLDYLLGKSEIQGNLKAYGHEFLLELATHPNRHAFRRGLMGRYWLFLISSFPYAFGDKLRQMNLDGSSERWYISGGGDPISTPELFRLNFYRLLLKQITECYLHDAALERWIDRFEPIQHKDEWCRAIRLQISADQMRPQLLAKDRSDGSDFAATMEDFLEAQAQYALFWKNLNAWLQIVSNYTYGQSPEHLFDHIERFKESAPEFESIWNKIKRQVGKFVRHSEIELISEIERVKDTESQYDLVFIDRTLHSFPERAASLYPDLISVNLSKNMLKEFIIFPGQLTKLRELDLSGNANLANISAETLLENCKNLRVLKLSGTQLAKDMKLGESAYANGTGEPQRILNQIKDWLLIHKKAPPIIQASGKKLKLHISFSGEDSDLMRQLVRQLHVLVLNGMIEPFNDILPGMNWENEKLESVRAADIVLLLISQDFIFSDFIMQKEVPAAMEIHGQPGRCVIPVYLRKCLVKGLPFEALSGLPGSPETPIMSDLNPDDKIFLVAAKIFENVQKMRSDGMK